MMKWVTPLLSIGTPQDAQRLGELYTENTFEAISAMINHVGVVVSTAQMAADVIRSFGAAEDWINAHVFDEWGEPHLEEMPETG